MRSASDYGPSMSRGVPSAQIGNDECVPIDWNDGDGRSNTPAYLALLLALLATVAGAATMLSGDPESGFGLVFLLCAAALVTAVVAVRRPRTYRGVVAAVIAAVIGAVPFVLALYILILAATCEDCFS